MHRSEADTPCRLSLLGCDSISRWALAPVATCIGRPLTGLTPKRLMLGILLSIKSQPLRESNATFAERKATLACNANYLNRKKIALA